MFRRAYAAVGFVALVGWAQAPEPGALKTEAPPLGEFTVAPGTKVSLRLINHLSTKGTAEGDDVLLKTAFPVIISDRIVIPEGSYVFGTVTQIKKPGRIKGRGELYIRFDSLALPNGVTRDFRARMGVVDGNAAGELDRAEGKVKSEGNKTGDARTVGESAGIGASIGAIAGNAAGRPGMGAGVGVAAGAAAGLIGVLSTRGPDADLPSGTIVQMVLDRPISYSESELNLGKNQPEDSIVPAVAPQNRNTNKGGGIIPRRLN